MVIKKQSCQNTDRFLVLAAITYVAVVTSVVAYFWLHNIHLFDLGMTVSLYVALRPGTAAIYFVGAAIICTSFFLYMVKTKAHPLQKVVYTLILLCVFTCALFPCNKSRSVLTTDIHDFFAYALVLLMALSFVLLFFFSRNKAQKVYASSAILFAIFFISAFVLDFAFVKHTIFIWENVIIVLFFLRTFLRKSTVTQGTVPSLPYQCQKRTPLPHFFVLG